MGHVDLESMAHEDLVCCLSGRGDHPVLPATHEQLHPGCRCFICITCYDNARRLIYLAEQEDAQLTLTCRYCRTTDLNPTTIGFIPIR